MRIFGVFTVRWLPQYASFKQEIIGDAEISVAQKITAGYDSETGAPGSLQAIGKYIRSSEENISTLTKKVDNGKNLIPITSGWEGDEGTSANYDPKNFAVWEDSDLYCPAVMLAEGDVYCFSAYMSNATAQNSWALCYGRSFAILSDLYDNAYTAITLTRIENDRIKVGDETYYRYCYRVTAGATLADMYVTINYWGGNKIYCPQVELLENASMLPTPFSARSLETTSQIKQTAEEIDLGIRNGLQRTGIDITNGLINLIANKTLFKTSDGTPMIAVQMCDAEGNVWDGNPSTASNYPLPSIVFYNGPIGQAGVSVQWVLNYLGFTRATNAGEQYSFSSVPRVICFEAPTGDKVNHIGVDSQYELNSEAMALTWFHGQELYEQMYLFNSGYYINDSGVKIYQPTNGKNYEMYNDMPDLRRYWLTRNVNNIFVPDLTTNATAKGYYCVVAEGNYEGNWPTGDQWHTVSSNTNRAGTNDPTPVDPIQEVMAAIKFHLVYFDETSFSESGPAGVMERYENAFVLFYHGWIRGVQSGIWKTCIAAIGGDDTLENNPTFYNDTDPDGICTIQGIIDKYSE